jgi:hypothetical protein
MPWETVFLKKHKQLNSLNLAHDIPEILITWHLTKVDDQNFYFLPEESIMKQADLRNMFKNTPTSVKLLTPFLLHHKLLQL